MTRKKFVKQLMAQGVQRNNANATAAYHRMLGHTYSRALREERFRLELKKAISRFGEIVKKMSEEITEVASAAKKAFNIAIDKQGQGGGGHD